jgi:hypothetical protein
VTRSSYCPATGETWARADASPPRGVADSLDEAKAAFRGREQLRLAYARPLSQRGAIGSERSRSPAAIRPISARLAAHLRGGCQAVPPLESILSAVELPSEKLGVESGTERNKFISTAVVSAFLLESPGRQIPSPQVVLIGMTRPADPGGSARRSR